MWESWSDFQVLWQAWESLFGFPPARQAFCLNGGFFLAPQANLGGGKVGILVLDFQFSTTHI